MQQRRQRWQRRIGDCNCCFIQTHSNSRAVVIVSLLIIIQVTAYCLVIVNIVSNASSDIDIISMKSSLLLKPTQNYLHRLYYPGVPVLSSVRALSIVSLSAQNRHRQHATTELAAHSMVVPLIQLHHYLYPNRYTTRNMLRTFIATTVALAPKQRLPRTELTRTIVRNMRKLDLEIELKSRGIKLDTLVDKGTKIKRTDLIEKLLVVISKPSQHFQPNDRSNSSGQTVPPQSPLSFPSPSISSTKTRTGWTAKKEVVKLKSLVRHQGTKKINKLKQIKHMNLIRSEMNKILKRSSPVLKQTVAISEKEKIMPTEPVRVDQHVGEPVKSNNQIEIDIDASHIVNSTNEISKKTLEERYNIQKLDSNKSYSITAIAVSSKTSSNGIGIGIILRESDRNDTSNGSVVWQAQVYYPKYRSLYEANYCAVIIALRHVVQLFHLCNIDFYVYDFTLHDQIMGIFPISKPSLRTLHEQISDIINEENLQRNVKWNIASSEQRNEAMILAQNALNDKISLNVGDPDDSSLTHDPMDEEKSTAGRTNARYDTDTDFDLKFQETVHPNDVVIDPTTTYVLRYDGGSRGNPGVAGAGMVLYDDQNREIWYGWKFLGHNMSNNLAEYTAINLGLTHALQMGINQIRVEGDSLLVCKQLQGEYKVKSDNLRSKFLETQLLMKNFSNCTIHHIPRKYNKRADELANEAMTTKKFYGIQEAAI